MTFRRSVRRRSATNCEPVHRRLTPVNVARAVVVLAGVLALEIVVWRLGPYHDPMLRAVVFARGALGGALIGLMGAARIRRRKR